MKHLCGPSPLFFNVERGAQERHAREKVDENRLQRKISRADPTLKGRGWVRLMVQNVRLRKDIERTNVKYQVLELLSANVPPKVNVFFQTYDTVVS